MRTLLWVTRPEMTPLAGAQHEALQSRLRERGWHITPVPYQSRQLWRRGRRADMLVWTFVPTQLEVWLSKRVAAVQLGLVHELPPRLDSLPGLDHWMTPSRSLCEALCRVGIRPSQVTVSTIAPRSSGPARVDVREELGLARSTPLIFAAGPPVPASGNRIAVWALNILNYLHPEPHLILQGQGRERDRLEQFHRSIDEQRRVHFAPPSVTVGELARQADQVWLPRQWDGVPDALFEALRQGRPIVAARQPSLAEWLRHEGNALLVKPDQPAEWATAANRILTEPELAATLGKAARNSAVKDSMCLGPLDLGLRALAA